MPTLYKKGDDLVDEYQSQHPRFWRFYRTASGANPVLEYLDRLTAAERAAFRVSMERVRERGLVAARHLRGDIYEVRIAHDNRQFRVLFAAEGRYSQVLLAVEAFTKKTQQTPPDRIDLAERRLYDHRARAKKAE
jgi:phage-related protein